MMLAAAPTVNTRRAPRSIVKMQRLMRDNLGLGGSFRYRSYAGSPRRLILNNNFLRSVEALTWPSHCDVTGLTIFGDTGDPFSLTISAWQNAQQDHVACAMVHALSSLLAPTLSARIDCPCGPTVSLHQSHGRTNIHTFCQSSSRSQGLHSGSS